MVLEQRDTEYGGYDVEAALAVAIARVTILHLVLWRHRLLVYVVHDVRLVFVCHPADGAGAGLLADQRGLRTQVARAGGNLKTESSCYLQ